MTNRQAFATTMAVIGATFDKKLPAAAIEGYWLALGDLDESDFAAATKRALTESKFMPSPSELLAFAGKSRNLTAECATAWEAVRRAIRAHDYTVATIDFGPLVNTALRCMGSWEWLCEQAADDMVWRQKDFERFYLAFAQGSESALRPEPLKGWGFNRVGCEDVRVPIAGKLPPLALPPERGPVVDVVRELAETLSVGGSTGTEPLTPDCQATVSGSVPKWERKPPTRITEEEKAAAVARMAAQLAGRAS